MRITFIITTPSIPHYNSFDFFISNLIIYIIQKSYANIVRFKSFFKNSYSPANKHSQEFTNNKTSHNKKNNILHKFLNKMTGQT